MHRLPPSKIAAIFIVLVAAVMMAAISFSTINKQCAPYLGYLGDVVVPCREH